MSTDDAPTTPTPYGRIQVESTIRQQMALELRKQGMAYSTVAEIMGISRHRAYKLIQKALLRIIKEPAEEVMALELARLDHLLQAVWSKASVGDPVAVNTALKVMERRAKLLGLDKGKDAPAVAINIDNQSTQVTIDWHHVIQENPDVLEAVRRSLDRPPAEPAGSPGPSGSVARFRNLPFIRRGGEVEESPPSDPSV